MERQTWQAEQFEAHRPHLQAVAYRMLGSVNEAEDAVQEAWLRLSGADRGAVANLGGWLTTVVARVCLDAPREDFAGSWLPEAIVAGVVAAKSPPAPTSNCGNVVGALVGYVDALAVRADGDLGGTGARDDRRGCLRGREPAGADGADTARRTSSLF